MIRDLIYFKEEVGNPAHPRSGRQSSPQSSDFLVGELLSLYILALIRRGDGCWGVAVGGTSGEGATKGRGACA